MNSKIKLSIIIPTLNEEEGIAKVICSIPENVMKQSETIVVDFSTDYTPIIAKRLRARVLRGKAKGKGRQMREAVKESRGEILIFLDGDGTDPPEYIPKLVKKLEDGADLVFGCRSMKNFKTDDKALRNLFKVYGFFMTSLFHLIDLKIDGDPLAGFRAIRRKDWDRLDLKSNGFEIETEMNIKAVKKGFVIKGVAIPHLKRCGGLRKSKFAYNPKEWFKISNILLKYFKDDKLKPKIKNWELELKSRFKI